MSEWTVLPMLSCKSVSPPKTRSTGSYSAHLVLMAGIRVYSFLKDVLKEVVEGMLGKRLSQTLGKLVCSWHEGWHNMVEGMKVSQFQKRNRFKRDRDKERLEELLSI